MRWEASAGLWGGWGRDIAGATVLALFLAAIGPYGSYLNGPLWQRVVFQLPCTWTATLLIGLAVRLAIARLGRGPLLWAVVLGVAALAMLPVAGINILMARWLWPFIGPHMTPFAWYWEGLFIAAPVSFLFAWLGLRRADRARLQAEAAADADAPAAPGLLRARREDVLCLQMEDHYVRVRTARGSHLVLATFGQAMEAVGMPGLRVHRSWWVADSAVARGELDGRNLRLVLTDGSVAPVARSSVAEVRARGWLAGR